MARSSFDSTPYTTSIFGLPFYRCVDQRVHTNDIDTWHTHGVFNWKNADRQPNSRHLAQCCHLHQKPRSCQLPSLCTCALTGTDERPVDEDNAYRRREIGASRYALRYSANHDFGIKRPVRGREKAVASVSPVFSVAPYR